MEFQFTTRPLPIYCHSLVGYNIRYVPELVSRYALRGEVSLPINIVSNIDNNQLLK